MKRLLTAAIAAAALFVAVGSLTPANAAPLDPGLARSVGEGVIQQAYYHGPHRHWGWRHHHHWRRHHHGY